MADAVCWIWSSLLAFLLFSNDNAAPDCWGYEPDCSIERGFSNMTCDQPHSRENFYNAADFGYVKGLRRELTLVCKPNQSEHSWLECTKYLRFCRGANIVIDFAHFNAHQSMSKYRDDVLQRGDLLAQCAIDAEFIRQNLQHKSPLQSWAAEIQNLDYTREIDENCDLTFQNPVLIIKPDAGISMYHHFCDFVNMFISMHVNGSYTFPPVLEPRPDLDIILWDTSPHPYHDLFGQVWAAFTDRKFVQIYKLDQKRVCFRRDVVFSLLPRMRFGFYYNMPLTPGCQGSGLMQSFAEHILAALRIPRQAEEQSSKLVRVTFLSRRSKYRRVLNEHELIGALKTVSHFDVHLVHFEQMPFTEQLTRIANTDLLIGVHGAGLTHLLFLPQWAALFELYNCGDKRCYTDLARLKGVGYFTWPDKAEDKILVKERDTDRSDHAKFQNFEFDVDVFMQTALSAADHVLRNKWKRTNKDEL